jgi:hypothetical protein
MARTAKVTVIIDDNGTMRLAEKSAKKLGGTLEQTGKSAQSAQRSLRGTAQMSSNSTKNFAKQSQVMNGVLVPAYATLAAQIFALTAVFRFFQSAADLRVLTDGQLAYAQATGVSLGAITASLQEATQGQLAFKEAAQAASIGVAAGLDASQLQRLSTVATQASAALGRDLTDSFNRLVKGAIKAEPELLDELGIIVRLQEASENYGRKIGKTANQLSTFEKSQAVVNAVLEQGEEKFGKFEIKVNQVNQAGKAFNDLLIKIQSGLAPFIELLSKAVAESGLFAAAIAGFAFAGPIRSLVPDARDFAQFNRQDIGRSMVGAGYTGEKHQERLLEGTFTSGTLRDIEKSLKATNSKVIDNSENARIAVQGLAVQARASLLHEAGVMEKGMKGFFKRMEAQFISAKGTATGTFASIRAAGTVAFTAIGGAIATAFNIVAIAGLLFTLGQLAFTYFRSKDANAAFNDSLKATTNSLKTQREEIEKVGASLVASGLSGVSGAIAASNFLRTQSFESIGAAAIPQSMIDNISESIDKLEELRKKNKQVQQDIIDGPIFMDKTGAAAMAGLMAARSEEPLLKNVRLTKQQTAAFMELQKTVGVTSQTLKDSGLTHIPKVNKAYLDMIKLRLEILKISTQEEQTLESLTRLREILNGLNTQGYSFISEEVAQITALTPVIKSGSDAANEFYKTLIEGTNALSKGDPFKSVRQNILDVRAALVEDLSIQEGMDRPVVQSAENLESIRKIFGASMDGSTTNPGYFIDLLDKLSAKYNTFYNEQFANESQRIRNNTEIASLFENTVDNAKRKAQLQTDNKILDLNDKIGEKLLLASQLRTEGSEVALRHAAIIEQDAASMAQIIVLSQKETALKNRLLDIAERKAELDTKATVKTNALKAQELMIDTSIAGVEKEIEQLRLTQAMTAMIIAKERKEEAESLRETSAEHARAADIADSNFKVAVAQVTAVENQNAALVRQRQLQEDLGRIQTRNLQLEGRRLGSQLGPQDTVLGRIRSANLDAEGFRNQAESKRREAQEQNLKQFEKDNLLLEAENLEKRANVAVYEASIQAQAAQGLVNSMREGLTDVFSSAATGGSIKDAILRFTSSFATTLQESMTNALVSSFMEASKIEAGMKAFSDKFMSFLFPGGGGLNTMFGAGGAGGAGGGTGVISSIFGGLTSFLGFRNGGIVSARGGHYDKMYSGGGIAKGRDSGYPAILHGTEAVVPLPDGKKIPVQMQGSNSTVNTVSVNVNIDQSGNATSNTGGDSDVKGRMFGEAISKAIQEELLIQTREGGLLNR